MTIAAKLILFILLCPIAGLLGFNILFPEIVQVSASNWFAFVLIMFFLKR
jgi:hypothetical protein